MIVSRFSIPIASRIALLNRRTPSAAILHARGMGVEDDRVARGQHVDRVARQRRQAVRDRRDRADDAERGVVGERQAVVARVVVGAEVLDARHARDGVAGAWRSCGRAGRSWSLRARAGPAPRPGRRRSCGCTRRPCGGRRAAGSGTPGSRVGGRRPRRRPSEKTPRLPDGRDWALPLASDGPVAHLGQDLLDHVADEIFGHLHGWHRCVLKMARRFTESIGCRSIAASVGRRNRRAHRRARPLTLPLRGEDHLAAEVDRVDQADHHGVDRQLFGFGRQPGARALADQDHLVDARAQRVDHDERAAGRHQAVAPFSSTR